MKKILFIELKNFSTEDLDAITSSGRDFVVVTDKRTGHRIFRFLKNEDQYLSREKTLRSRCRYLLGSLPAFLIPDFIHLWVKAALKGYKIDAIEKDAETFEIRFFLTFIQH